VSTPGVAELIVVRHGQSAANAAFGVANAQGLLDAGLTGRDADVDLTDLGRSQAAALGRWLHNLPAVRRPEVVICSPYLRARETWRYAAAASGSTWPAPSTDDRLVDRLTGDLELLTTAAIAARFPAEPSRLAADGEYAYRPPGGESFGDIGVRLTAFLDDLHRDHPGKRVIVVAHDAVVLMMRCVVENLGWDEVAAVAARGQVRNASLTRFEADRGRLRLTDYNTVSHLPPGGGQG
jgi:broad specificity phosphatase PhoE